MVENSYKKMVDDRDLLIATYSTRGGSRVHVYIIHDGRIGKIHPNCSEFYSITGVEEFLEQMRVASYIKNFTRYF